MDLGIALATTTESWRHVKRAEALGFSNAWFYDTQLLNPDVFIAMTQAAMATQRIRLGTGVLIPSNRIEPVTANALASLNKIAPGRIDFGVGTGFTGRRTMGLSAIPLKAMKTYIRRVQTLLRGETLDWTYENKHRKIRFLNPDFGLINLENEIPLFVSAMGPKARDLVAELNAGWLNFNGSSEAALKDLSKMQQARANIDQKKTGQQNSSAVLFFLGCVLKPGEAADSDRAMSQAGPLVMVSLHNLVEISASGAFAKVLPGPVNKALERYREIYLGYPEQERHLYNHRGHLMFLRPEERELISEEMIRSMTFTGTLEELRERFSRLRDAGYSQFAVQLVEGQESALEDWAEVFQGFQGSV